MRWLSHVRLLPATLVVAGLVLSVKIGGVWQDVARIAEGVTIATAIAQETTPGPAAAGPAMAEAPIPATPQAATGPLPADALPYSKAEIELLQKLADRRETLERRERALEMREGLVEAAEAQLEARSAELAKLQSQLKDLVKARDEAEAQKLQGLVSIYEKMKPKDAARIMNELDMEVLVGLLARMRDAKTAPILAGMDAEKARAVTARLAEHGTARLPGG